MIRLLSSSDEKSKSIFLICCVIVFSMSFQNTGMGSEKEIVLSEVYQTKKEKEVLEDRFKLEFGWTYGISSSTEFNIISGFYDLDPTFEYYLDKLDMEYSRNFISMRISGTYLINPRLGISATMPFGAVEPKRERVGILPNYDEDYEFAVGDVTGGMFYYLLPETELIPLTRIDLNVNSNNAKYTSMGNGVWDIAGGLQLRKLLFKPFYVFGLGDYTYTMEENDVNPGDITGYGGGIGLMFSEGEMRTEVWLKKYNIGESEINDIKWLPENDSLVLNLSFITNVGGMNAFMAGIEDGFDSDRNSFGLEYFISF